VSRSQEEENGTHGTWPCREKKKDNKGPSPPSAFGGGRKRVGMVPVWVGIRRSWIERHAPVRGGVEKKRILAEGPKINPGDRVKQREVAGGPRRREVESPTWSLLKKVKKPLMKARNAAAPALERPRRGKGKGTGGINGPGRPNPGNRSMEGKKTGRTGSKFSNDKPTKDWIGKGAIR